MVPQRSALAGAAYGLLATVGTLLVALLAEDDPSWLLTAALLPLWPGLVLGAAARSPRLLLLACAAAGVGLVQVAVVLGAFSGNLLGVALGSGPVVLLGLGCAAAAVLTAPRGPQPVRPTTRETA